MTSAKPLGTGYVLLLLTAAAYCYSVLPRGFVLFLPFARITYFIGYESLTLNYFNYFTEIEETFTRRRGRHLLLSPTDWALIESWKTMGVPLHIALRGITQAFDSYEAKPRRRAIKTLFYCQEEVEAQFDEWRAAQQGAGPYFGFRIDLAAHR